MSALDPLPAAVTNETNISGAGNAAEMSGRYKRGATLRQPENLE